MYYVGETLVHRNAVVSGAESFPTSRNGIDCGLNDSLALEISITGTSTPTWTLTPGYWSPSLNAYCAGSELSVNAGASGGNLMVEVDTLGAVDMYITCENTTGTSSTITIYARQIRKG